MDANLQRPFQLASRAAWAWPGDGRAIWDESAGLRLIGTRVPRWSEDVAAGEARRALAPGALDRFGTHARIEELAGPRWQVVASGAVRGDELIVGPGTEPITDAVLADDVLYLAIGGAVVLRDLRGRWADRRVEVGGGRAWRLAPSARGVHVAVIDGAGEVIALGEVVGRPLRAIPHRHAPGVFRPEPEEADPPRFVTGTAAPVAGIAALATSPGARPGPGRQRALVAWTAGDARLLIEAGDGWRTLTLTGARRPYALAWLDDDRLAVLLATTGGGTTAAVYRTDGVDGGAASPVGELYPLLTPAPLPFLHGDEAPPRYLSRTATGDQPRPLLPLSWPAFATTATVDSHGPIDGLTADVAWHRLYLEGALPPGTAVTVWLGATDDRATPPAADDWFPHRFGDAPPGDRTPRGVWLRERSELPFHPGLLGCPPRPGVAGLFTVLVQRHGRRTRTLRGRYLWLRLELVGDGRATPELVALRAYADRHAYAARYLPELYREDLFGPDADVVGAATPADFLDRFLGLFESVLTPLEDRIAGAWLVTHPQTTPDHAVDWLASWLGFAFAADLPLARRRAMLAEAWPLYQRRGTLDGLRRALDLATGGGVGRGELVVVEDFRLRRTFATILGADLSELDDPLTPGLIESGNSIVGETLVLGREERRSFLALFDQELVVGDADAEAADEEAIAALFDRLAHRVTVLVHQEAAPTDLGLLRQVIELEAPAHVEVKVVPASERFRVAVASLVGVDTFLGPPAPRRPVVLDRSDVGVADVIERLPSLDPRLGRTS